MTDSVTTCEFPLLNYHFRVVHSSSHMDHRPPTSHLGPWRPSVEPAVSSRSTTPPLASSSAPVRSRPMSVASTSAPVPLVGSVFSPSSAPDGPDKPINPSPAPATKNGKSHVPSACANCKKAHLACDPWWLIWAWWYPWCKVPNGLAPSLEEVQRLILTKAVIAINVLPLAISFVMCYCEIWDDDHCQDFQCAKYLPSPPGSFNGTYRFLVGLVTGTLFKLKV
ncbi:hypothetical protein BJ085DRAFT_30201 [Dimargaris cristalligena]|uniref:Uncharacterized protein n=1 Tax=Dimargaris cristalligena TaxID=215637 RepID=A0A4P9ZRD7_9FUNG|nr:hypothetical protein BJ085DRAFT_30201 [Dimargaris cristalligena]|eukprot:RKP35728.1 hypothetical protein BJ085DRAFT_30201 [Dimargaris cristalligena]